MNLIELRDTNLVYRFSFDCYTQKNEYLHTVILLNACTAENRDTVPIMEILLEDSAELTNKQK